ncbi:MAG: ABC transporter ATP-binding protein [Chloroflexi bacterium]|nr:ABC transporter ATP-binding protein [Chloroflexota bacterium]
MSIMQVIDLHQRHGSRETLKGVSFSLEQGEVFGIIGPTGSGKTTLLRLLDQIEVPSSGRVYFEGRDVTGSPRLRSELRRKVGMVLQKPVVFDASVYDNVAFPLRLRRYSRKVVHGKVDTMLNAVGLDGYQRRNARTLSGGETQKVALARALITNPQALLLDEPTANLDPVSLKTIEEFILRFSRENGTTIVIATHEMAQGQRLADRIGVIMEGQLVQIGKPSEIFYAPSDIRVARFVGVENILEGRVTSNREGLVHLDVHGRAVEAIANRHPGDELHLFIRPEDVVLSLSEASTSARNSFSGQIAGLAMSGPLARVHLDCGFPLVALITRQSAEDLGLQVGKQAHVSFKATAVHVIGQ